MDTQTNTNNGSLTAQYLIFVRHRGFEVLIVFPHLTTIDVQIFKHDLGIVKSSVTM